MYFEDEAMPLFRLDPLPDRLDDPCWTTSRLRSACVIEASTPTEARRRACGYFTLPCGAPPGLGQPWLEEALVTATELAAPPLQSPEFASQPCASA
jgi:hypothetical protein